MTTSAAKARASSCRATSPYAPSRVFATASRFTGTTTPQAVDVVRGHDVAVSQAACGPRHGATAADHAPVDDGACGAATRTRSGRWYAPRHRDPQAARAAAHAARAGAASTCRPPAASSSRRTTSRTPTRSCCATSCSTACAGRRASWPSASCSAGGGLVGPGPARRRTRSPSTATPPTPPLALEPRSQPLRRGECVVIYPEGTVTEDPGSGRCAATTGVARLALLSGAPVVPVAQWGAQRILDSYADGGLHLLPRQRDATSVAGPPVDLSAYARPRADARRCCAARPTRSWTPSPPMLEELRGERAPAERYDPRTQAARRRTDERRTA